MDAQQGATPVRARNRKSRGRGIRQTTGCITCRRRHVKCDELRPECHRCQKGEYTCVYSIANSSAVNASAPLTSNSNSSTASKQNTNSTTSTERNDDNNEHRSDDANARHVPTPITETSSSSIAHTNLRKPTQSQWENQQSQQHISHLVSPVDDVQRAVSNDGRRHTRPTTGGNRNSSIMEEAAETRPLIGQYVPSPEGLSVYASAEYYTGSNVGMDGRSVTSALSPLNYNAAIGRWFDLLATDAELDASQLFNEIEDLQDLGNSTRSPNLNTTSIAVPYEGFPIAGHHRTLSTTSSAQHLRERGPDYDAFKASERQQWLSSDPLQLQEYEHKLFQNFVRHISRWIDLFDPWSNFSTFVPHLAMHNIGLMKAILTLSARHLSLNPDANQPTHDRNDALQYYNETLHFVAKAMQYDTYKTSLELLATALIVSAYEMLDGSGKDWERHLQGVFLIQRSQVIHGDSKGLKQAVWWAWLCQDIWAAFLENRKTFTFWEPVRKYDDMNPHELAVRSVFLVARVIDYCSREEFETCDGNMLVRTQQADRLTQTLEDWHQYLTAEFNALPWSGPTTSGVFEPIWIHPPAFGVAIQLYNTAQLLLLINRPSRGGLNEFLQLSKMKQKCVANICGIAMTLNDYASSILSSQCLYIAGTCIQDGSQRTEVLELLRACRQKSGWPIKPLDQELKNLWARGESASG